MFVQSHWCIQLKIQGAYKLSEDFAKPYFHKYWTEIHDITTIWKRNVCSFIVTLNAFDLRPTCDTADIQAILPFPPNGGNGSIEKEPSFRLRWSEKKSVVSSNVSLYWNMALMLQRCFFSRLAEGFFPENMTAFYALIIQGYRKRWTGFETAIT